MNVGNLTDLDLTLEAIEIRQQWEPVLLAPRQKFPAGASWEITRDVQRVDRHIEAGGNLGLIGHERTGLAILDDDQPELFAEMVRELGPLSDPWVRTGSGKFHYYVAWQPGLPAKLLWQGQKVGEIQRGPGQQQIVAPPSVHPETGRAYAWLVDPRHAPLPPLPEAWRAALTRSVNGQAATSTENIATAGGLRLTHLQARAVGQPGARWRSHDGSIKFQCPACRAAGADRECDNARLAADGTWGCAGASGTEWGRVHWEAIGVALDAFKRRGADPTVQPSEIKMAEIDEILAAPPESLVTPFIAEPWIPAGGVTTLTARAGVGKGKLAQDLCIARVTGGAWLDRPVKPGPALFWSAEQGKREDFRVTQAFCRGRGLDAIEFQHFFGVMYDPPLRFGEPLMLEHVLALAREHPDLFVVIDSLRRAFAGEDTGSEIADGFFQNVIVPLRGVGATVLVLAHPPKTTGQQKRIDDENMVRGSGDFVAQLDSLLVLRPLDRKRLDPQTEIITMRLRHPKARGSAEAVPHVVTMRVTNDRTPTVSFTLSATADDRPEGAEADLGAAIKAVAALFEEKRRLSRKHVLDALQGADCGRPAIEGAIKKLVELSVLHGPLGAAEKQRGERGHWFLFVKPLSTPGVEAQDDADEDHDEPF